MERVFFFGGIAGVVGGFSVIFYQAVIFLKDGIWNSYTILSAIDKGPGSLVQTAAAYPAVMNALQKCPASASLIVIGMLLLWGASRLRNRYA